MSYTIYPGERLERLKYIVVGCGGTGGFVAEGLCRLLGGSGPDILLIDHDRVEPHNLKRQNFYPGDVGKFKSQALAERLARQYGRKLGYSILPFDPDMQTPVGASISSYTIEGLVIGCVDNTDARRLIGKSLERSPDTWWLDAGNDHHSGQVLIGNANDIERLKGGFEKSTKFVTKLPMPSLQAPSLLIPPTTPLPQEDCAEAVEADEQSPVINQAMATVILQFVELLRRGKLTWMGAYINLEADIPIQTVPAEPEIIARMLSVKVDTLFAPEQCSRGMYMNNEIVRANSFI